MSNPYDWRITKKGWPYKGLDDPEYIKDKEALFAKHRNGWWYFKNDAHLEAYLDGGKTPRELYRVKRNQAYHKKAKGGRMDLEGNSRGIK
jgi:hypothetical protein